MLKKILIGGLAVGSLALNAPFAHAAAPAAVACNFRAVAQATVTGGQDTFTGAAWGYVVSATPTNNVSIRCYLTVDGVEVTSTPTGTGTGSAATGGQITYTRSDTQALQLHAEWTDGNESGTIDYETQTIQVPPQEVIDAIDSVFALLAELTAPTDPLVCGLLQTAGVPGIINSTTAVTTLSMDAGDCDLYLGGERLIDFVPYED